MQHSLGNTKGISAHALHKDFFYTARTICLTTASALPQFHNILLLLVPSAWLLHCTTTTSQHCLYCQHPAPGRYTCPTHQHARLKSAALLPPPLPSALLPSLSISSRCCTNASAPVGVVEGACVLGGRSGVLRSSYDFTYILYWQRTKENLDESSFRLQSGCLFNT